MLIYIIMRYIRHKIDCLNGNMKTTAELVSPLLSWKIKLTSLVCITLVLYIHSFFSVETVGALRNFQLAFIRGLCDVAVPTFFAMSGFLFFVGTNVAGG